MIASTTPILPTFDDEDAGWTARACPFGAEVVGEAVAAVLSGAAEVGAAVVAGAAVDTDVEVAGAADAADVDGLATGLAVVAAAFLVVGGDTALVVGTGAGNTAPLPVSGGGSTLPVRLASNRNV